MGPRILVARKRAADESQAATPVSLSSDAAPDNDPDPSEHDPGDRGDLSDRHGRDAQELGQSRAAAIGAGPGCAHPDLAEMLRYVVELAGVERPELFTSDETRIGLRFHDLRATAVTWWAVRGDGAERIWARTGHEDWATRK